MTGHGGFVMGLGIVVMVLVLMIGADIVDRRRQAAREAEAERAIRDAATNGSLIMDAMGMASWPVDQRRDFGLAVFRHALANDADRNVDAALAIALKSMAHRAAGKATAFASPRTGGYAAWLRGLAAKADAAAKERP